MNFFGWGGAKRQTARMRVFRKKKKSREDGFAKEKDFVEKSLGRLRGKGGIKKKEGVGR